MRRLGYQDRSQTSGSGFWYPKFGIYYVTSNGCSGKVEGVHERGIRVRVRVRVRVGVSVRVRVRMKVKKGSGKRVSNPRPAAWEAAALPTELLPLVAEI